MTDQNPETPKANLPHSSAKQTIWENLVSLFLALLLVFLIRSAVVEPFKIPSGSMIPTLLVGDHIFVNKFAYGIKLPFSDWILDHPIYIIKREGPKHGDIVVFIYPRDESLYYIKRVVGLPGDTVELRDKVLYVNGAPVDREALPAKESDPVYETLDDARYVKNNLALYREKVPNANHLVMIDKSNYLNEAYGPMKVPEESLFVMGDNRDFSNDSRVWGFVPMKNVKGKAFVIWLSVWVNFSDWKFTFRPERIGTILN